MIKFAEILLIEGRYDAITTDISRFIINVIKKRSKGGGVLLLFPNWKIRVDVKDTEVNFEVEEEVPVKFEIKYNEELDVPYIISGEVFGEYMMDQNVELYIVINPKNFPKSFSAFIPELKEAIRHELEHIDQFHRGELDPENLSDYQIKVMNTPIDSPELDMKAYFLLPHEVPAYVKGIYKGAKTAKVNLDDAMDAFLNDYISSGQLTKSEKKQVKKVWVAYAKKHFPAAKWSEQ